MIKRGLITLILALKVALSVAQCDTTGILLELQATTNLSGFLIGSDRCIVNAILTSPLSFSGDTLSITKGNLTAGSSKVSIGGTGTGALLGAGANVDVVPANILLSTLGGALNLNQLSTTGASTNQIVKFNGTVWALGADDTGAGTGYQTIRDNGVDETQRVNANFLNSGRIAWTITDDIPNTETEIVGDIVANSIGDTHIRQGVARSIVGVTGNATANVADIQGTTDQVLRVSTGGTSLAFGQIASGGITNNAVGNAQLRQGAAKSVVGVTGNATANVADIATTVADQVLVNNTGNTAIAWGTVATNGITNNAVTDAKLRQGAARSVIGVTGNATANVANIQGTTDQVLRVTTAGTGLSFGTVATGGITNSAITYAKIQNAAANNVLLGNNNGAATAYEEISVAAAQTMLGFVDGVGVAGRHAYWTDANTLSNDADNLWDATNNRMTISNTVAGVGSGLAGLNIQVGAQTGPQEMIRMSGNVNGNMFMLMSNASILSGSNTANQIIVGGDAAGDPFTQYTVTGVTTTSVGIDNSDGNKFKISPNVSSPGFNVNNGIIVTNDAIADVGINMDAPIYPLDVSGRARATQYIGVSGQWSSANIAFGTGAGTGPVVNSISGPCNAFTITYTTGTAPAIGGIIFTATFPTPFPLGPSYTVFSSRGAATSTDNTKFFIQASSDSAITFQANGTLLASTQYSHTFYIFGN